MIRGLLRLSQIGINNNGFRCSNSLKVRKCQTEIVSFPRYISAHTHSDIESCDNEKPMDREKRLKVLQLELDVFRQEGRRVPEASFLKQDNWDHVLSLNSRSARRKYYTFLWQIEKKKENEEAKKLIKKEERAKRIAEETAQNESNEHIIYSLMHTSFLLRVYDSTINHWNNAKLIRAMQFGQKLIMDCSYDKHMIQREAVNAAKQLMLSFSENRLHDDPFDLHFCNINLKDTTMQYLKKHIPTLQDPEFPLNLHEQCFTKIFPKEKLVYLTPHCKNDLKQFNHDDIYIIGCMVDKMNNEPLSLAKAKKLGLRMAKLPVDQYLQWGPGSGKSLTLNQMTNILLDLKNTDDWKYALRHVPRRKLYDEPDQNRSNIRKIGEKYKFNIDNWGSSKNRFRN